MEFRVRSSDQTSQADNPLVSHDLCISYFTPKRPHVSVSTSSHKQATTCEKSAQINRLNFPFDPASGLAAQVGLLYANMGGYRGALYPESIAEDFNRFGACHSTLCRNISNDTLSFLLSLFIPNVYDRFNSQQHIYISFNCFCLSCICCLCANVIVVFSMKSHPKSYSGSL